MKKLIIALFWLWPLIGFSQFSSTTAATTEYRQSPFTSEYQAVLTQSIADGNAVPSLSTQLNDDNVIRNLKINGDWDEIDVFYKFTTDGSAGFSRYNWKNAATNYATLSGTAPTFVTNLGWYGAGSNTYLDLNYTPSTQGVKYVQNSSCFGLWFDAYPTAGKYNGSNTGTTATLVAALESGTSAATYMQALTGATYNNGGTIPMESHVHGERTASNVQKVYVNGTGGSTNATASQVRSNRSVKILARDNNGTIADFTVNATVRFAYLGSSSVSATRMYGALKQVLNFDYIQRFGFPDWKTNDSWALYKAGRVALQSTNTQTEDIGTLVNTVGAKNQEGGCIAENQYVYGAPYGTSSPLKISTKNGKNLSFGSTTGSGGRRAGGCLAPNGNIYIPPLDAGAVVKIAPYPIGKDDVTEFGSFSTSSFLYISACVGPAAQTYLWTSPAKSGNVLVIDYSNDALTVLYPQGDGTFALTTNGHDFTTSSGQWAGITLGADGKLYCAPWNATKMLVITPASPAVNSTYQLIGTFSGADQYAGIVQSINANDELYLIPYTETHIVKINPHTQVFTTLSTTVTSGVQKWGSGCLNLAGKIVSFPQSATTMLLIDPSNDTVTTPGSYSATSSKYVGAILIETGQVIGIPNANQDVPVFMSALTIPLDNNILLSRYTNHY